MTMDEGVSKLPAVTDLAVFLGMEPEDVAGYLPDGERLTKLLWDSLVGEHEPDKRYDPAVVERYYRHPVVQAAYLLALTEYWSRPERQKALARYVDLLAQRVPKEGLVLDWGAGTAEILAGLERSRPDINAWAVDYPGLRSEYVTFRTCAMGFLDVTFEHALSLIAPNKCDVVICTSALEHVEDIEATTRMLVDLIKPGGYALFEVDWVYNSDFPMHLPVTASWRDKWATELMPSLGMTRIVDAFWLKTTDQEGS